MTVNAHFDGKVIVPDEPPDLRPNQALIVQIEPLEGETEESALAWIAANAVDSNALPTDLADQHDHYLYVRPKKETRGYVHGTLAKTDWLVSARIITVLRSVRDDAGLVVIEACAVLIAPVHANDAAPRNKTDLCHPATVPEGQGHARDEITRHLGVGWRTIERAEAVVEAAEEVPEECGY